MGSCSLHFTFIKNLELILLSVGLKTLFKVILKCEVLNYLLIYLGFGDGVVGSPGVAEAGFEFLIL